MSSKNRQTRPGGSRSTWSSDHYGMGAMSESALSVDTGTAASRGPLISWFAVVAVTMGIFSIVTTEILPIGLLTSIGASFHVSDGTAGALMTMPGIVAAVAAPLVTVLTGRVDRRRVLCLLMALLALADLVSALAPAYWVLLLARAVVGLVIGGFWSIGAGLAGRLVRARSVGRATAVIFAAVPLGSVLGVPAGTLIGQLAGWRAAFLGLGGLTVAVLLALLVLLPPLPPSRATRMAVLRGLLRRGGVRLGLLATFLVVLAHFGTYTYVTRFLREVTRLGPGWLSVFLLGYGAAGILGNFVAGATVSRRPRATFMVGAGLLACATLLLPVLGRGDLGALGLLLLWGLAYGAVPVCSQTWFARSAPDAPEAATVLFTSSFQATISVGALVGGIVVDAAGPASVLLCGGVCALLTVAALGVLAAPGRSAALD
jgi:predicted MFS family arabinose efflux permease